MRLNPDPDPVFFRGSNTDPDPVLGRASGISGEWDPGQLPGSGAATPGEQRQQLIGVRPAVLFKLRSNLFVAAKRCKRDN